MARRNNRNRRRGPKKNTAKERVNYPTTVSYYEGITVGNLAKRLERKSSELIKILFLLGNMATINTPLSDEEVELIALELQVTATKEEDELEEAISLDDDFEDDPEDLVTRPPVVTIMGHVDHGKTSLLDAIRTSNVDVTAGEFGGITQHIGAYQVTVKDDKKITFLDTPGHEAFTAMRARGAKVTDLAIIVVAADDGVMPQTKEAVDHALAAETPIIVAVNKIDKPDKNIERIYTGMSDLGLMPEAWGGDTMFAEISAKTGEGINELLEAILLISEMEDLSANPKRLAVGTAIEAELDKGRGPVATLLIQNGTLRTGDEIVVGSTFGRVRRMTDELGNVLTEAGPSRPVEVLGLNSVPTAGDGFKAYDSEKEAKDVAEKRKEIQVEEERSISSAMSLEDLALQIREGNVKEIPILVKADVQGTAEAVKSSLEKINVEGVRVNVIRSQAGGITESDIMLAAASGAFVYGFNVRPNANVRRKAEEEKIAIRLHNVIYNIVEEVELAMKGMLDPTFEEVVYGQAEVRSLFKASKIGTIAGCMVVDGVIKRDSNVRLIRNDIVVYDGELGSLKRFENDAKEVTTGYECGVTIKNFNDIKVDDIIESYGEEEVPVV